MEVKEAIRRDILQILNEEWADGTNSEIAYMILDKVDEYIKEAKQDKKKENKVIVYYCYCTNCGYYFEDMTYRTSEAKLKCPRYENIKIHIQLNYLNMRNEEVNQNYPEGEE